MARILSHPFRLTPSGAIATVEQDSDAGDVEQIAVLALTRVGERPTVPGFGIVDPTFGGFHPSQLVAGVGTYGPPVNITGARIRPLSDHEQAVVVEFD